MKKLVRKLFGLEEAEVKVMAEVKGWPDKWEHTPSKEVHDGSIQLEKVKEEQIKKEFLPEPQTHRRTVSRSYVPPAEGHREAISKFMKGKASSRYLKTIKQSPKIKIEEEEEN